MTSLYSRKEIVFGRFLKQNLNMNWAHQTWSRIGKHGAQTESRYRRRISVRQISIAMSSNCQYRSGNSCLLGYSSYLFDKLGKWIECPGLVWGVSACQGFGMRSWPSGKLPLDCQKFAKNLQLPKIVIFFQNTPTLASFLIKMKILWAMSSYW